MRGPVRNGRCAPLRQVYQARRTNTARLCGPTERPTAVLGTFARSPFSPFQRMMPPTLATDSPVISWLFENVDVVDAPAPDSTVVLWLDLAATAVPMATEPAPIRILVRL